MKRKLSLLIAIVMVLTCVVPMGLVLAAPSGYGYTMTVGTIAADDTFTLDVSIFGGIIAGGTFTLDYDETKVDLLDAAGNVAGPTTVLVDGGEGTEGATAYFALNPLAAASVLGSKVDVPQGRLFADYAASNFVTKIDATTEIVLFQPRFKLKPSVTADSFDKDTFTFIKDPAYFDTTPGIGDDYAAIVTEDLEKMVVNETTDDLDVAWDYPGANKTPSFDSPYYRVENTEPDASDVFQITVKVGGGSLYGGFYTLQYDKTKVELVSSTGTAYTDPMDEAAATAAFNVETGITALGAGASIADGYMFAGYYDTSFGPIDAADGKEVLLFSPYFKLLPSVTTADFDEDTFKYADEFMDQIEEETANDFSAGIVDEDEKTWTADSAENTLNTIWDQDGGAGAVEPTPTETPTETPTATPTETPVEPPATPDVPTTFEVDEPFTGYANDEPASGLPNTVGGTWSKGTTSANDFYQVDNTKRPGETGVLHFHKTAGTGGGGVQFNLNTEIDATGETYVFEYDFMMESPGNLGQWNMPTLFGSTPAAAEGFVQFMLLDDSGPALTAGGQKLQGKGGGEKYALTAGDWHKVKVVMNFETQKFDVFIFNLDNPDQFGGIKGISFKAEETTIKQIGWYNDSNATRANDFYLDNLRIYKNDPAFDRVEGYVSKADSTELADLSTNIALDESFIVDFTSPIDYTTLPGITLTTAAGTNVPVDVVMVPGSDYKQATVTPKDSLNYSTNYVLKLSTGVENMFWVKLGAREIRFATERLPGNLVVVTDTRFTDGAGNSLIGGTLPAGGNNVNLAVDLSGVNIPAGQAARIVVVTLMIKNSANELVGYKTTETSVASLATVTANLGTVKLPAGSGLRAEIFVWDKAAMIPYAPLTVVTQ